MTPGQLREPQHMTALARANEIRLARSRVKRDLRAGRLTLADALEHPAVQTMTLAALLDAQERWGDVRVTAFLARLSISPSRRIGDLTPRQRQTVLAPKPAPPLDKDVTAFRPVRSTPTPWDLWAA